MPKASTQVSPARLATAQRGLVLVFFGQGIASLASISRVPEFIDLLGVDFTTWGLIVGFGVIGNILPLFFTHRLVHRFGSRPIVMVSVIALAVSLASLSYTESALVWFFLNMAFLVTISSFNIALNAHAITVQRLVGHNVVGKFHGSWSMGAAVGAIGGGLLSTVLSLVEYLVLVAAVTGIAMVVSVRLLLPTALDGHSHDQQLPKVKGKRMPAQIWLLGLGLFAGVFPEMVMGDWSTVFARDVMRLDSTLGTMPFVAFTLGMIIGRLSMTRLSKHYHPSDLARFGGFWAAATVLIGLQFAPILAQTDKMAGLAFLMIFWGLAGLGLAPMVPALFSAGGHVDGWSAARVLSRMSLFSSVTTIGAKWLVGALAEGVGLQIAFYLPVVMLIAAALISGEVAKRAKRKELDSAYPATGPIGVLPSPETGA